MFPPGGSSFGYYAVQATTAAVLVLAANTAFQGFPRLAALLASDSYLPRQFSNLGDRLVYSNGILVLALAAGALIVGFHADVLSLIHLYLLGVFTAFTLSQFGMVRHNWERRASRPSRGSLIYAIGAQRDGRPAHRARRRDRDRDEVRRGRVDGRDRDPRARARRSSSSAGTTPTCARACATRAAATASCAGRSCSTSAHSTMRPPRRCATCAPSRAIASRRSTSPIPPASAASPQAWRGFSGDGPPLVALPRERTVSGTVARYVRELEHAPGEVTTLVVPELFRRRSLARHRARAHDARAAPAPAGRGRTSCWPTCPWWPTRRACAGRARASSARACCCRSPSSTPPRATRSATRSGSGPSSVIGLHVELGADDVSQTRAAWAARGSADPDQGRAVAVPRPRAAAAGGDPRDHGRPGRRLRRRHARDHQPAPLAAPPAQPARAVHQAAAAVRGARGADERARIACPRPASARPWPATSSARAPERACRDGAAAERARRVRRAWPPSAPARRRAAPESALDGGDLAACSRASRARWRCSR